MRIEIEEILHTLRDGNAAAKQKRQQITDVLNNASSSVFFIKDLEAEISRADCLYCDEQPFCRFYITFAYYKQNQSQKSKDYLEEAIEGFRIKAMEWNEAMSHWLLGEILYDEEDFSLSQRSLERATKILEPIVKEFKAKSNYKEAERCEEYIRKIQVAIDRASASYTSTNQVQAQPPDSSINETSVPKYTSQNADGDEGYIVIPSIPIYEEVEAGQNGPAWADYFEIGDTEVHQVILQGKAYKVFSTKYNEKLITIFSNKKYAWAKIHGHSMNTCHPTPICEGDYILFHIQNQPQNNDIVVASHPTQSGDFSYMVKRFSEPTKQLISETSDTSQSYPPLPVDQDYQILGIVIAVAKAEA
jgi:SOS-response transcriptional repressor LexA